MIFVQVVLFAQHPFPSPSSWQTLTHPWKPSSFDLSLALVLLKIITLLHSWHLSYPVQLTQRSLIRCFRAFQTLSPEDYKVLWGKPLIVLCLSQALSQEQELTLAAPSSCQEPLPDGAWKALLWGICDMKCTFLVNEKWPRNSSCSCEWCSCCCCVIIGSQPFL